MDSNSILILQEGKQRELHGVEISIGPGLTDPFEPEPEPSLPSVALCEGGSPSPACHAEASREGGGPQQQHFRHCACHRQCATQPKSA